MTENGRERNEVIDFRCGVWKVLESAAETQTLLSPQPPFLEDPSVGSCFVITIVVYKHCPLILSS